jgi:protein subunit release factor B
MGDHYAEIMKELNAKNDEVAFLNAQRSDRDAAIHNAEVHIRSAEAALHLETQQRDVVIVYGSRSRYRTIRGCCPC